MLKKVYSIEEMIESVRGGELSIIPLYEVGEIEVSYLKSHSFYFIEGEYPRWVTEEGEDKLQQIWSQHFLEECWE